jgi:hypothetical protein
MGREEGRGMAFCCVVVGCCVLLVVVVCARQARRIKSRQFWGLRRAMPEYYYLFLHNRVVIIYATKNSLCYEVQG